MLAHENQALHAEAGYMLMFFRSTRYAMGSAADHPNHEGYQSGHPHQKIEADSGHFCAEAQGRTGGRGRCRGDRSNS